MAQQLVLHLPNSNLTLISDDSDKMDKLMCFCLETLDAYNSTGIPNELTIDELDKERSDQLYSLIFELGLL